MKSATVFVLLLSMGLTSNLWAESRQCLPDSKVSGVDTVPWPWGQETKFPWEQIQGVWIPDSDQCSSAFIFKLGKVNKRGEKVVAITQYDPLTCAPIAKGVGYEYRNVLYAKMVNEGKSFDLTIRAFGQQTVLVFHPENRWSKRVSMPMTKVHANPSLICD